MKNPFMSMWLSYANTWANMMRGFWSAEMQRQQSSMMNAFVSNWMKMMSGGGLARSSSRRRSDR